MPVLHQIIAVEQGVKKRSYAAVSEMHKTNQHATLFEGIAKQYQPKDEGGEAFPPESSVAQKSAAEQLTIACELMVELFDITATKDSGNTLAKADVTVDGQVLVKQAPVPFLLFLEKQLSDMRAYIAALPTLDPAVRWTKDANAPLYYAEPVKTHRTKKVQKALILAQATEKHPAQAVQVTEDEVVGYWTTTRSSAALPVDRKALLLARVDKLTRAVKFAREEANGTEVQPVNAGAAIFRYLLA